MRNNSIFYALLAVLCWSTVAVAFKKSLQFYDPANLVMYSSIFSFLFFFLLVIFDKKKADDKNYPSKENIIKSIFQGMINPFLYYLILFKAYDLLLAQEAQVLNYTWGVMLLILSIPILKHKLKMRELVAVFISFFGIVILATKGNIFSLRFSNPIGVILALSSSILWASYWLINVQDKRDSIYKLSWAFFFGSIFVFIYVLIFDEIQSPFTIKILGPFYIGMFEMGFTFWMWQKAMEKAARPSKIANLIYLSPFLSLVFISIFLGEKIHISTIGGLIFLLIGVFIQNVKIKKEKNKTFVSKK